LPADGKFLFEFDPAVGIEFEKQTFCIVQRQLIWTGERIVFSAKLRDGADEKEWGLGVGDSAKRSISAVPRRRQPRLPIRPRN
jgi:hypothetical protein